VFAARCNVMRDIAFDALTGALRMCLVTQGHRGWVFKLCTPTGRDPASGSKREEESTEFKNLYSPWSPIMVSNPLH